MSTAAPDKDIFAVFVTASAGPVADATYAGTSEAEIVRDIAAGQHDALPLAYVLAFNPVAGTCRDMSAAIAEQVIQLARWEGWTLPQRVFDWCEVRGAAMPAWANGLIDGHFVSLGEEAA